MENSTEIIKEDLQVDELDMNDLNWTQVVAMNKSKAREKEDRT